VIMQRRMPVLHGLHRPRWKVRPWLMHLLAVLALLLLVYLASPYVTLWRLERAVAAGQPGALDGLVDIAAVRDEVRRRLNKNSDSRIGEVSDSFIDWLQQALRRAGADGDALRQTMTLNWLAGLLTAHIPPGGELSDAIEHAFFDTPTDFEVRIDGGQPLHLHLEPRWLGWQVTAVYY
jgi:AcrR family transcriptional regulator